MTPEKVSDMTAFEEQLGCPDPTSSTQCGMNHITLEVRPGGQTLVTAHGEVEIVVNMAIQAVALLADTIGIPRMMAAATFLTAPGTHNPPPN